jgi:hypothetical protein
MYCKHHMYPEVSCPSKLLYSIYTGREAQYNTTNNYTQSPNTEKKGDEAEHIRTEYIESTNKVVVSENQIKHMPFEMS